MANWYCVAVLFGFVNSEFKKCQSCHLEYGRDDEGEGEDEEEGHDEPKQESQVVAEDMFYFQRFVLFWTDLFCFH